MKEVRENVINDLEDVQCSSRNSVASVASVKRPSDTCQTGTIAQQTRRFFSEVDALINYSWGAHVKFKCL